MEDITTILAFEIKKEMADRYFGFRKRIEEDTAAYTRKLTAASLELEDKIGTALIRIFILLGRESLIQDFLNLTGLPLGQFYDPYVVDSNTIRKHVFTGCRCRGFSRRGRFKNMFLDTYDSLARHIVCYQETITELNEEQETIRETIDLFYKKNDIDTILSFIRRLEAPDSSIAGIMQTGRPDGQGSDFSTTMRLQPPIPVSELLPNIPALPTRKSIHARLKSLITAAFQNSKDIDLREIVAETG